VVTIPVEAQMSTEQLLHALEQLPPKEFVTIIDRLLAVRAQRQEPHLSQAETALLFQINQGIDTLTAERLNELTAKRRNETITPDELQELIGLTDKVEQFDAQRLAALDALAGLWRISPAELMSRLGIPPPRSA
jgi:hypothetical protein